jgi:hypothetical protein
MANQMGQFKSTANEHMRQELKSFGKWTCQCEACKEIRALVGMDKTLEVRRLVREVTEVEAQLDGLIDGPERQALSARFLSLYDKLADEMGKQTAE